MFSCLNSRNRRPLLLVPLITLLALAGCGRSSNVPEPLPPERAPNELTSAFEKAKPELKEVARKAGEALEAKRYPEASMLLTELSRETTLSAKERDAVTRAMLGVNRQIQEQQTQGDAQSAEYLRQLQRTK